MDDVYPRKLFKGIFFSTFDVGFHEISYKQLKTCLTESKKVSWKIRYDFPGINVCYKTLIPKILKWTANIIRPHPVTRRIFMKCKRCFKKHKNRVKYFKIKKSIRIRCCYRPSSFASIRNITVIYLFTFFLWKNNYYRSLQHATCIG